MEFNLFYRKVVKIKMTLNQSKRILLKFFPTVIIILIIQLLFNCENSERFYRPNLPEKLCSIGIIDIDDTILRHISFEKSYQVEYPEELNDSLRELSFTISSSQGELFNYRSDSTMKDLKDLKIPDSIAFVPGEKYFLRAKEQNTPEISAEVTVPEIPSNPHLISINEELTTISYPDNCREYTTPKSAIIEFSFQNDFKKDLYYAILLEGTGYFLEEWGYPPLTNLLEFTVLSSNSPGFFSILSGVKLLNFICTDDQLGLIELPIKAFFIDGSKIPDTKCVIKLATQFHDNHSLFVKIKSFRLKLLSVPKQLYLFEKSLYTYDKTSGDPFTEPIYLNGNIKSGNGVFAICRSTDLTINLSPPY